MPLVGIGELARMLERDPKALRNAVASGRLSPPNEQGLFDSERALQEWEANTNHNKGPHKGGNRVVGIDEKTEAAAAAEDPVDLPLNGERPAKGTDYAKARAATQIYEARLKKLKYEEKAGSFVPARDIQDATHQNYRIIRDACMNIPSRCAALLAVETDIEACYQILENEVMRVFSDFAEGKIA